MVSVDPFGIDPPFLDDSLLIAGLDAALPFLPPEYSIADAIAHNDTPIDVSGLIDPTTGEGTLPDPGMAQAPEPSSIALLLTAAAGALWFFKRRKTSTLGS
jgi:hypothetical protein